MMQTVARSVLILSVTLFFISYASGSSAAGGGDAGSSPAACLKVFPSVESHLLGTLANFYVARSLSTFAASAVHNMVAPHFPLIPVSDFDHFANNGWLELARSLVELLGNNIRDSFFELRATPIQEVTVPFTTESLMIKMSADKIFQDNKLIGYRGYAFVLKNMTGIFVKPRPNIQLGNISIWDPVVQTTLLGRALCDAVKEILRIPSGRSDDSGIGTNRGFITSDEISKGRYGLSVAEFRQMVSVFSPETYNRNTDQVVFFFYSNPHEAQWGRKLLIILFQTLLQKEGVTVNTLEHP